ncbi:MAG: hybrid sensor histidine kinase/response regulator [Tannerellaceae bacterium]
MIELNYTEYKLLVVDDTEANLLLLKALLQKVGFKIITAKNGLDALDLVEKERPDLLLLDVMMPIMDGYQTALKIREKPEFDTLPIIFLTALNSSEDVVKGFSNGGNDFITKPFNKEELIIRIRHQLSLVAARRIIDKQTEELIRTIEGRDKLYSVIAHDLRGPLGSIKMIQEYLITSLDKDMIGEENAEMLSVASHTTEDLFLLLDNLLKWTKNQMGRLNVVFQEIEVVGIVEGVVDIYKSMAQMKEVDVKIDAPQQALGWGDADMIKTVVRNLLGNAIKFSYPKGEIHLRVRDGETSVVVDVVDHGCGIKEEDQSKMLRTDVQFSTFGTKNEEGSGLGLLLCQDLVKKINGEFWFTSIPNEGSTFSFSIPKIAEHSV